MAASLTVGLGYSVRSVDWSEADTRQALGYAGRDGWHIDALIEQFKIGATGSEIDKPAKFHNAQTMLLGTVIGLTALWVLWSPRADRLYRLKVASALASYYWITQAGSLLFPGTALVDPQFAHPGQVPAQLIVDLVMLVLLTIGYVLETRRFWQNAHV